MKKRQCTNHVCKRHISNLNEYPIQEKALSSEEGMSIATCSVCCYIDNTYQIETTEEQISGQINNFLNFFFPKVWLRVAARDI